MGITQKRIILVGDAGCGKSALALRLTHSLFAESYIPTSFDSLDTELATANGYYKLTLQDTSGARGNSEVRKMAYEGCDVAIVCFDLSNKTSYENIETRWLPELSQSCPGIPVIVAGCKRDEIDSDEEAAVTIKETEELIERVGAVSYIECSARTNENIQKLFQTAVEVKALKHRSGVNKILHSVKSTTTKTIRRSFHSSAH